MAYKLPILISVPHGGDQIPQEHLLKTSLTPQDIFEDGDSFTRDIYNFKDNVKAFIDTQIARACIDLNRAPTDRPPKNKDGIIKTETVMKVPVYKNGQFPSGRLIEMLLQNYYLPYHKRIEQLLQNKDIKLALDCHSMLPELPPINEIPGIKRPLICLSNGGNEIGMPDEGSDTTTCPTEWIQTMADCFCKAFGFNRRDVKINDPFKGGYIINSHSRNKIPWMQIEINRLLYLNKLYYNHSTRTIQQEIIQYLRNTIFKALEMFCNKTKILKETQT